jgi:recombination protein RecA
MPLVRADLELLLRSRRLDRTLTTAIAAPDPHDDTAIAPTSVTALDAYLGGGFPRGQLSELIGPRSSGRTSVLLQAMAAATGRGELVGLIDALDTFDVESALGAGLELDRVLWIRGHVVMNPGMCRDLNQRALEQAIRAFALVLQAGNFGLVVFDVADAPADAVRRLPFTTWLRLQRMVEGSQTACVLVGTDTMARSSAGVTVRVDAVGQRAEGRGQRPEGRGQKTEGRGHIGPRFGARLFEGLDAGAVAIRAHAQPQHYAPAAFRTSCHG